MRRRPGSAMLMPMPGGSGLGPAAGRPGHLQPARHSCDCKSRSPARQAEVCNDRRFSTVPQEPVKMLLMPMPMQLARMLLGLAR